MTDEYDLQLVSGDLVFDAAEEPVFLAGRNVIEQDIVHRLRESGLPARLVGNMESHLPILAKIARETENDERIAAGTATALEDTGSVTITAETLDGQIINV